MSEVTSNTTIYCALKAHIDGVPKKTLRKRIEAMKDLLNLYFITRQQYLTIKGRVNWFLKEESITLRRTTKYSGYTKHYKDKGSLGTERDYVSEFLDPVSDISEETILKYFTVGEIDIFGGDIIFHPEENQKVRNGKLNPEYYEIKRTVNKNLDEK